MGVLQQAGGAIMKRHFDALKQQFSGVAGDADSPFGKLDDYLVRMQMFLQEFFSRAGKPVDTMYRVALERYHQGEYADAANRLRLVTKFQPENADAWYLMGSCDLAQGNAGLAAISLRKALALNPQSEEARFLLAVADPNALPAAQQPKFAPLSLATEYFDGQAEYYDEDNLDELGYLGHEECYAAVKKYLNPNYKQFRILDLGCGTGLVGLQFRDIAGHVDGVDISQAMLDQAEARRDEREGRVYDKLHLVDLRRYLLDCPPNSYDLVTAGNVFPYIGGLTPVFDGVLNALKPGGIFTFSIEPMQGEDFGLIPAEGRFAHSEYYITEQAQRVGLSVLEIKPFEMFVQTKALQCVLRKPVPQQAPAV
jgi:predicted TPR repeat methyltransferase